MNFNPFHFFPASSGAYVCIRKSLAAGLLFMLVHPAYGQDWQFGFDPAGNLATQTTESSSPPQILAQPQRQIIVSGEAASFFVVVADPSGISYQWRFNGTNISGASQDTLLLQNVGATNEGSYSVVLLNSSGSITSAPAALLIDSRGCGMPDSWQLSYFGNLNQTATGDFDGDGVPNLQEFLDGTDPANAASALYRIVLLNDGGTVVAVPNQPAYTNGQVVMLTATGSDAAPFHGWTGDAVTRSNSITVTMNTNLTLFAHFTSITFQWTSAVSGDWNVPSNWTPNFVPGSNDSVVLVVPTLVTLNSNADVADFTLGTGSVGPELTGTGTLTIHGRGAWASGNMSGTGTTVIAPGASLTIAGFTGYGGVYLVTRTLENSGTVVWGGGNFNMNGGIITNDAGASFKVQGAAAFNYQGGAPRFDNAGALHVTGTGTTTLGVSFNNFNLVDIQGGTFSMSGGGNNTGTITVPAGTTLNFGAGIFTSSGNPSITGAGTLQVSGGAANLGGIVNVTGTNSFTGGTANFDGSGTVAPQVLNLNGTLGGANTVTVGSAMNWTGGTMDGSGQTTIRPGATLTIAGFTGYGGVYLVTRTLENSGTVVWGGGNLGMNSCIITNDTGASFQIQGAAAFNYQGGSPRFDNAGALHITGTGTTTLGVSFTNYGTVDIQSGILAANASYVSSSNAVLNCALSGTIAGTNYGQLQVAGSVILNGTLSVNLASNYVPSTNDSFTVLTAGTRNGTFASFVYSSNQVTMQLSNTTTSVIVRVLGDVASPSAPLLFPPLLAGYNVLLTWTAVSNITYRLEFNPGLTPSNWNAVPGDVIGVSNTASKLDTQTSSNRFYRVQVLP